MNITSKIHRPRAGQEEENIARIMDAYGIIMCISMHPAPSNPIFSILQPRLNRAGHHYRCAFFTRNPEGDTISGPHMETIYSVPKDEPRPTSPRPAEVFLALLEEARMMDAVPGIPDTPEPPRDLYIEQWYPHLAYSPCEDDEIDERREDLLLHIYSEQRDFRYLLEMASPEDDTDPNALYRYLVTADLRQHPEDIPPTPHRSIILNTDENDDDQEGR